LAGLVSIVTLATLFINRDYNRGVLGAAVWFLLGTAYFAFFARRRLVLAPEEQFAIAHGNESQDPSR
jgi:ethanolamine permease